MMAAGSGSHRAVQVRELLAGVHGRGCCVVTSLSFSRRDVTDGFEQAPVVKFEQAPVVETGSTCAEVPAGPTDIPRLLGMLPLAIAAP